MRRTLQILFPMLHERTPEGVLESHQANIIKKSMESFGYPVPRIMGCLHAF